MSVVPPPGANTRFSRTLRNVLSHNALHFSAVCYRLSRAAERAFSPCGKARFMSRYGTSGTAIRVIRQCGKAFFVLRRHIFPRPSVLKHLPDSHFPLLNPHFPPYPFLFPHFPLPNLFYSRKRINIHSLTLSPPHSLTLLYILPSFPVPSFPFFTSLIFYPFTSFTSFFTSLIFTLLLLKNLFSPFTLFPFPASYNSFSSF